MGHPPGGTRSKVPKTAASPRGRRSPAAAVVPLPGDVVPLVLSYVDPFNACKSAVVCSAWRKVVTADKFWAERRAALQLTEKDRGELRMHGYCHTRAGVYCGPHKLGPFGSPQTPIELEFQRTDRCLVLGLATQRRDLDHIADLWRDGHPGDVRPRGAGSSLAPDSPVGLEDQLAWIRRVKELSGIVVDRMVPQTLGRLGGSQIWNAASGVKLRVFTLDEALAFLEAGGESATGSREPASVPLFGGRTRGSKPPLRPSVWPVGQSWKLWIPVADFEFGEHLPKSRPSMEPLRTHAALVAVTYDLTPHQSLRTVSGLVYYTRDENGYTHTEHMTPFCSICHFMEVATNLRDDPDEFLDDEPAADTSSDDDESELPESEYDSDEIDPLAAAEFGHWVYDDDDDADGDDD